MYHNTIREGLSHGHRHKNLVKFNRVVFKLCKEETDIQTDILFTVFCTRDEVTKKLLQ